MPELGRAALIICLGLAAYALVAGAYAAVTRRRRLSGSAQNALLAAFAAAGVASAVLFAALLRNDFSFTYVADHTSRELPTASDRPIQGKPIGRDGLMIELAHEMIPYTPEQLLVIGQRENAWCEAELTKAAREMGLGDDWRKAVEKVKRMHVLPGQQPYMIRELALEAIDSDVIKTYVRLGMGVGIVAEMAVRDDPPSGDLVWKPAGHLFGSNLTRVAFKRGAYLRQFVLSFAELLSDRLTRPLIQRAMNGDGVDYDL